MEAFYFSPMLLGVNLILAVAISATALWLTTRPISAPFFWMLGAWSLVIGIIMFGGFIVTRNPVLNVLGNVLQLVGEGILVLGVFRFIGRPVPYWIVPASVLIFGGMNIHYWIYDGNSDLLMVVYAVVAGLLPLYAVYLLILLKEEPSTRSGRILVGVCLGLYSIVTFMRAGYSWEAYAAGQSYIQPYESFSYLFPYNFGIPALVMAFIGMTLMTMQRILAVSHNNAANVQHSAQRFERLLNVSSAGIAVIRDGRVIDANIQLETLLNISRPNLLETEFLLYFKKSSREQLSAAMALADGELVDVDVRRGDDAIFNAELRAIPLTDQSGDFIIELRDVSRRRNLEDELKRLATIDPLTGVLNRRSFDSLFVRAIQSAQRKRSPLCLALFDLDHFKEVNDTHGHQAGDQALRQFSLFCDREARATDVFARIGGEEFALFMPDTDLDVALITLQRLLNGVSELRLQGREGVFQIEASAGVAQYVAGDSVSTLMKRADLALYKSKDEGRNRISVAEQE